MKKLQLLSIYAAASIGVNAQIAPTVSYNGLTMQLNCKKTMTLVCQPKVIGYIDSNNVDASYNYKSKCKTEFHTKKAIEATKETISDNHIKYYAEVTAAMNYGGFTGSTKGGFESDYYNRLQESFKTKIEEAKDIIDETAVEINIKFIPKTAIQLYECVITVPGEYTRVYDSPKVDNSQSIINYTISFDYSNDIRNFYKMLKECSVSEDSGEWSMLNTIGTEAYNSYNYCMPLFQ